MNQAVDEAGGKRAGRRHRKKHPSEGYIAMWAQIEPQERAARTQAGRTAFVRSFLERAGGDPELAAQLRSEWYSELGRKARNGRRNGPPGEPEAAG